ncbi:MAG: AAA family ATPase [Cyclobacteriaceae bacterium]|nr:AAA family ATPase [Cyclobacteriaceae bacterium]
MKITGIEIKNLRGFLEVPKTQFSKSINVFIGPNNAGKTTILNTIFNIQRVVLNSQDVTIGQTTNIIKLYFEGKHLPFIPDNSGLDSFIFELLNGVRNLGVTTGGRSGWPSQIPEHEPLNLIYPYLSKRKTAGYQDVINESNANSVIGNFTNLFSKIDRLVTPQFQPGNRQYVKACDEILGFQVSSLAKGGGKQAVYFVHNLEHIPLTSMGEGVANVLGLITDLCVAEERIFLIEEPENDIHPKALKALLNLIVEKSQSNQFFISTHSNIVMKYLGASNNSKVFHISNSIGQIADRPNLFVSTLKEVSNNPEERREVLQELGYDFFDFDLWKGWLFLEESSAEIIIRDYLIDWFVKPLKGKIRTFSAGGSSAVIPKFEDFDKLFIFLHLEPTYKNKVWVIIDTGEEEEGIIKKIKEKYTKAGWNESNFSQFSEHDFEKYYPSNFKLKVDGIISITDKQKRRNAKKQLLDEVKQWIALHEDEAKEKFKESAKEVIEKLKQISKEINK